MTEAKEEKKPKKKKVRKAGLTGRKLAGRTALLFLFVAIIAAGAFFYLQILFFEKEIKRQSDVLLANLSAISSDSIILEDTKSLENLISKIEHFKVSIYSIRFENEQGEVMSKWTNSESNPELASKDYVQPITIEGENFGRIVIRFDEEAIKKDTHKQAMQMELILLGGLFFMVVILHFWIRKAYIKPVEKLSEKLSEMTPETEFEPLEIDTATEIFPLIESANNLAQMMAEQANYNKNFKGVESQLNSEIHQLKVQKQAVEKQLGLVTQEKEKAEVERKKIEEEKTALVAEAKVESDKLKVELEAAKKAVPVIVQQAAPAAPVAEAQAGGDVPPATPATEAPAAQAGAAPAAEQAAPPPPPAPAPAPAASESKTILIVEDEAAQVKVAKTALEKAAYTLLTAEDPDTGLELFKTNKDKVSLAILPLVILEMLGDTERIHKAIREENPEIKILYTTGPLETFVIPDVLKEATNVGYVEKPLNAAKITTAVKNIFEPPPPPPAEAPAAEAKPEAKADAKAETKPAAKKA